MIAAILTENLFEIDDVASKLHRLHSDLGVAARANDQMAFELAREEAVTLARRHGRFRPFRFDIDICLPSPGETMEQYRRAKADTEFLRKPLISLRGEPSQLIVQITEEDRRVIDDVGSRLRRLEHQIEDAITAGDKSSFDRARREAVAIVRSHGRPTRPSLHRSSSIDVFLPPPDQTMDQYKHRLSTRDRLGNDWLFYFSFAKTEDAVVGASEPAPSVRVSKPKTIDLSHCWVINVRDVHRIEVSLSEERRTYPNSSTAATLIKEVAVSNSVARTVTIETSKLKAINVSGGYHIVGFPSIQGQVEIQLTQRHSVSTQNTISFEERTTIQIPPNTTVEHVIKWKLVSYSGTAILGATASAKGPGLAEVPYQVPYRLTYTDSLRDVRG
jgi:hypothetical protein